MLTPNQLENKIFLKYEFETIKDNLCAFINNFGEPRITREDAGKGFYVFFPADSDDGSWIQFCYDINYLNGWLYGVVQGVNRGEFHKDADKRIIAILHFDEDMPPEDDEPLEEDIVIRTSLSRKEILELARKISRVKVAADNIAKRDPDDFLDRPSTEGFSVPSNWDDYGWDEKLNAICEYFAGMDGSFTIETAETAVESVN